MIRNLKALGLAMVAVFAMSAVVASAAQAETGKITTTSKTYPAIVTGEQEEGANLFIIGSGVREVTCEVAHFEGTISGETDPLTVKPKYEKCHANPGKIPAKVTLNGCDYTLIAGKPGTTGEPAGSGTLSITIDCEAGKSIEVDIFENATKEAENVTLCTYSVGAQGPLTGSTYTNKGSGTTEDITGKLEAKPVTKVVKGSKILCGAAAGSEVSAVLKGNATLQGFKDEGSKGVQVGIMVG